ncbi:MAG: SH3 domain-containing protein [Anaerolineae bacterium]|nr:SH3 domain-containing protein [Anaerolineae bacterium]
MLWGAHADAATLREELEANGYGGVFAYRFADEAARSGVLPDDLAAGMLGFDAWSYASPTDITTVFLRDYIVAYGHVPGPLAAAGYDAMWFLWSALREGGTQPSGLLPAVIGLTPQNLVQGVLHPREFLNGDLSRLAVVYQLGPHGGPTVVARFDDIQRLGAGEAGGPPVVEPTVAPAPTTGPVVPTPTLDGVWIEVIPNVLNVRTGPDFNYDQVGKISAGERYRVLGMIADTSWLVIDYQGGVGWVKTEYATVLGNLAEVSILQPPPTPTPAATPTPAPPQEPDIVIDTVVLSPAQPIPGQPFTATVTVRNRGAGAAGRFAVAATWEPGSVFVSTHVEGLAGGQVVQIQLNNIVISGTGVYTVGVVADLNNEVAEADEGNNTYNVTYRADFALNTNQSNVQLNATTDWDLFGGTADVQWDGANLAMRNGSLGGVLAGVTYDNAHYDMLSPGVVNNAIGFGNNQVLTNAVFGIYTAEGQRAVIRVDNRQGNTIWISYRVYV